MKNYIVVTKDSSGRSYCAVEDPQHHLAAEASRILDGYMRVHQSFLDDECALSYYPNNIYFVFEPS
jgi:hypothetical protein